MATRVAVRLEGGLGDHILGMRVLEFIPKRYPDRRIIAYSDSNNGKSQLEVAGMSPHITEIKPIFQDAERVTLSTLGYLSNIKLRHLREMKKADVFIDAFTESFFIDASRQLGISPLDILAARPRLNIPRTAIDRAAELLASAKIGQYVAVSIAKYGPELLGACLPLLRTFLAKLMDNINTGLVNIFTSSQQFRHWPSADRQRRERNSILEVSVIRSISDQYGERALNVVDESIPVVAALLSKCRYFVGVDNGIRHLAWALNVPRTWILPYRNLSLLWVLRYGPDYHRSIQIGCDAEEVSRQLAALI